jgi:hypothetical protein
LKSSILNVSMHITTYSTNSGITMNFIQEYVSISLSIAPTILFLWPPFIIFNTTYVNFMF